MGASYANLFLGFIEHQFFSQYNGPKPELYSCYIDNCISAASSTRKELTQFLTGSNSFDSALKYNQEISDSSLAFLDIKISKQGNSLCTSVYYKPTDSHRYLLYSSLHQSHVKNSIPISQSFSDFVVQVVLNLIWTGQCASFLTNMGILFLLHLNLHLSQKVIHW